MFLRLMIIFAILPLYLQSAWSQPVLRKQGAATQLIVDGRPFLILGGELHNSTSSSLTYMESVWQRMVDLNINTVLAGLNWELIEPGEGRFDFTLVDGLIEGARRNNLRLVFLWFASWKNGMSSYAPLWVKKDYQRFPRVQIQKGGKIEVLSTFYEANWNADAAAFAALMRHIREVDGRENTVIMVQIENEVGVLGDSRDRCAPANEAFASPVPPLLMDYLQEHRDDLVAEIYGRWEANGFQSSGTWAEIFGPGPETDEMFMAWHYARYIDKVAAAGKAEYDIPMFVNAWLAGPDRKAGDFPSGGPLPYDMDIWLAGAPHIDLLAPDIYSPDFSFWCTRYTECGNPLFIPETSGYGKSPHNFFSVFGEYDAMGISPFAVDSIPDPGESELSRTYAVLEQMSPLILEKQGKQEMIGFVLNKEKPSLVREIGGYELEISLDSIFGFNAEEGYGIIISTGLDEFIGAGSGFRIRFKPKTPGPAMAGIGSVDEGTFQKGLWIPRRRLNGDENDQGRYWRFDSNAVRIEKCVVYRWE